MSVARRRQSFCGRQPAPSSTPSLQIDRQLSLLLPLRRSVHPSNAVIFKPIWRPTIPLPRPLKFGPMPLPERADELCAVARHLGASDKEVEHDGTLERGSGMTKSEGSCGLVHEASCHILVCGGPKTQTMMQGYASAASSEAADPFCRTSLLAMKSIEAPPPRTVIG